jgi:ferredoxin
MKVIFRFPDGSEAEVEGYSQLNLLAHAQIAERSLQSRCGGHCECSTCRIRLVSGRLSPMRDEERELLTRVGALNDGMRLACQAFPEPTGNSETDAVVVEVPKDRFKDARGSVVS